MAFRKSILNESILMSQLLGPGRKLNLRNMGSTLLFQWLSESMQAHNNNLNLEEVWGIILYILVPRTTHKRCKP